MGHRFSELSFTESVKNEQRVHGSRALYERLENGPSSHGELGAAEIRFVEQRDSFYMASVGETGWPYVQHRGGPIGFVKVLSPRSIGFVDFSGNRQYVTLGNVKHSARVCLFFMDYAQRKRLKLFGRAQVLGAGDAALNPVLALPHYPARVERALLIAVEAFDWNCSQHITPRYTQAQLDQAQIDATRETSV
jgi:predicted pyridoxine 5'-phosphate oxidase superfamily flavin-nucleotide-binding protein